MDMFLKISVLLAIFRWLGDLDKKIENMSLEGKCCWEIDNLECQPPFLVINNILTIFQTPFSPFSNVVIFNLHQTT